ncbi:MAG: hypothetical protein ACREVB_02810, partial [Burkholderiales bacterium]
MRPLTVIATARIDSSRGSKRLDGGQISVSEGQDTVSFAMRDASAAAQVSGATAMYRSAFDGVDVSYQVRADALKELITLQGPSSRRAFVWDLKLSDGLRPDLLESGALAIRDAKGALSMSIPAPFLTDAKDRSSHAVSFALDHVASGWRLSLRAQDGWLDASERAYPVRIDPQVFPAGQADCTLDQAAATTDFCAMSTLAVGGSVGGEKRAALRFDVDGAVPDGSTVTHASIGLLLQAQSAPAQGKLVYVHNLLRAITAGATWNSPWTTAG